MTEPDAGTFFEELAGKHIPLLRNTSGTVMVEVGGGGETERWYIGVQRGDVSVSRSGRTADCVVRTDRDTLDAILAGKLSVMPAMLRGLIEVEGKVNLLAALQAFLRPSRGAAEQRRHEHAGRRG